MRTTHIYTQARLPIFHTKGGRTQRFRKTSRKIITEARDEIDKLRANISELTNKTFVRNTNKFLNFRSERKLKQIGQRHNRHNTKRSLSNKTVSSSDSLKN